MSKIFITGDTHCPIDIHKLNLKNFKEGKFLNKNDYLIICGDAGFIWDNSKTDKWWIDWINTRPWTTLFIDGNHENFDLLNKYPIEKFNGGNVHKISDSLYHLMRGEIFTINDKKLFCFGGGFSHDLHKRIEHISWWQDEMPTQKEIDNALNNLETYNNQVDYIITHDTSLDYHKILGFNKVDMRVYDRKYINLANFLQYIDDNIKYEKWYHGHFHIDENIGNHIYLYNEIIEI